MNTIAKAEGLPRLIEQAASALAKATGAAEVLDARVLATAAYGAAKLTGRLAKMKGAHDAVVAACRKAMADALVIEAQAQCRLADEYDAAQERGEVKAHGRKSSDIPNENITSTVADIGLTSKQVHEARAVRDAEKAEPGVVEKTVTEKLKAGEEPSRADVKRAVRPKGRRAGRPKGGRRTALRKNDSPLAAEAASLVLDQGMTNAEAGAASGLGSELVTRIAVAREEGRREALEEQAALTYVESKKSAKEKVAVAVRHHLRKLDQDFDRRVLAEVRRRMDEIVLPAWRETIERADAIVKRDKGVMTSAEYKHVRSCLHPDRVQDASLKVRFAKAFGIFEKLEKFLCKPEKEPPAKFPRTWQEAQSSTSEQEHPNG